MAHYEKLSVLARINTTLVMKLAGDDYLDVAFTCPDCKSVAVVEDGAGECKCRKWKAMITVHGSKKRTKGS